MVMNPKHAQDQKAQQEAKKFVCGVLAAKSIEHVGMSQEAANCPCPECTKIAAMHVTIAFGYTAGMLAFSGDSRMLNDMTEFVDQMRKKYDVKE